MTTTQQPAVVQPKKPDAASRAIVSVEANADGVLVPTSLDAQYRLSTYYHVSGLMPSGLNSPEKILVALQFLWERKLPPMSCIGKICVINGVLSTFGDLPLALARSSKLMSGFSEWLIDKNGERITAKNPKAELYGAVCTAVRADDQSNVVERFFTIDDAITAKLWAKQNKGIDSPWVLYPKRMLQMRTRAWTLKDTVPDALHGLSIAEYDHNVMVDERGGLVGVAERDVGLSAEINKSYLSGYGKTKTVEEPSGAVDVPGEPVSGVPEAVGPGSH